MDVRNHELSLFKQRIRGTLLFSLWEPLLKAIKHANQGVKPNKHERDNKTSNTSS